MARTRMIQVGVWAIPGAGKKYYYRAATVAKNCDWTIYRLSRVEGGPGALFTSDQSEWEIVETGFKSKISAVEFAEEIED